MAVNLLGKTITNAACIVKSREAAEQLLASAVTRVTVGSVRLDYWPGNSLETYYFNPDTLTAWNSKGLPDQGLRELIRWLPDFHEKCRAAGKELAVSIAGTNPDEYAMIAAEIWPFCDIIEINAGCGNMWAGSTQKPIPSYEPELLQVIIDKVGAAVKYRGMLSVKISPVPDELIAPLAAVLSRYRMVIEVVGCNTMILQEGTRLDGTPALAFVVPGSTEVNHLGGMSGRGLKPDSIRVMRQLRPLLPGRRYLGCGGIFDGQDALDYLEPGADGFAVGTAYCEYGRGVFSQIIEDAVRIQSD